MNFPLNRFTLADPGPLSIDLRGFSFPIVEESSLEKVNRANLLLEFILASYVPFKTCSFPPCKLTITCLFPGYFHFLMKRSGPTSPRIRKAIHSCNAMIPGKVSEASLVFCRTLRGGQLFDRLRLPMTFLSQQVIRPERTELFYKYSLTIIILV
jgi:hypothetical protein